MTWLPARLSGQKRGGISGAQHQTVVLARKGEIPSRSSIPALAKARATLHLPEISHFVLAQEFRGYFFIILWRFGTVAEMKSFEMRVEHVMNYSKARLSRRVHNERDVWAG